MKNIWFLLCALFLISCTHTSNSNKNSAVTTSDQQLQQLILTYQEFYQQSSPFNDPKPGKTNAKLPNLSPEFLKIQNHKRQTIYNALLGIEPVNLSTDNQINRAVLAYTLKNQLDNYKNHEHYMPLTAESGFHVWISNISQQVNFKSKQDYLDYLSRLRALPHYFDQQTAWMNLGIQAGLTQPKVVLKGFEQSILAFIKEDVTKSGYYKPFNNMLCPFPPNIRLDPRTFLRWQSGDRSITCPFGRTRPF